MRPKLLDLFCGAGGASAGYHRAGFDVTGVDVKPQPRYPFHFVRGDALEYLAAHGHEFDAVAASPPCFDWSTLAAMTGGDGSGWLLDATRNALDALGCCFGAAVYGPGYCTCWEPVYDLDQAEPDTTAAPGVMPRRCSDCAYLRKSPERSDEYTAEWLDRIAATGERFWCHDGLRRPASWRHPSGATIPGDQADYQPPIIDGVPYRADGRPGDLCAGWTARALKASREADR